MFADMSLIHWLTLHGLVTVVAVLVYVLSSRLMHQRRHPAAAVAWLLFILLLPYLALPVFLVFGSRKLARPALDKPLALPDSGHADAWAIETLVTLGQPWPEHYRELVVHADGHQAQETLREIIDGAQRSIELCTYLIGRDELGEWVIERLSAKARAGVHVRLLLDGMGSLIEGRPKFGRLVQAGGELVLFVPPLHSPLKGRTNLRNHRKLLVADRGLASARLWSGGRNLASEYFTGQAGNAPWRDLSFDIRGPLIGQAGALFEHDWAFAGGKRAAPVASILPPTELLLDGAQLVASGPDQADDTLYALLLTAAYRARRRIVLASPYFVPDAALLQALCLAARRGVVVDLLLPAHSNHRISDLARGRPLRTLATAGARIWLIPEMMHAKMIAIDDVLALVGSANLDIRSLFLNYELMFAFHKAQDIERFIAWFDQERATASRYVATSPGLIRDALEGLFEFLGFQL